MAKKAKIVKRETTRMRPETTSREGKIHMLVAAGLGNASIWAALEEEHPSIIEDNKRRHSIQKGLVYDAVLRGQISRAINSTRGLARKDDDRVMASVEAVGGNHAEAKTLDQLTMLNRHRWSWGIPALDFIYGHTAYVHLTDHSDSRYEKKIYTYKQRDEHGVLHTINKPCEEWIRGSWKAGDPMIPDGEGSYVPTRDKTGALLTTLDMRLQIVEHGCPEAFMSIWGGEPGVGKSKTAIEAAKAINLVTQEPIIYVNGEESEENFRMKVGNNANPHLFRVVNAKLMPVDRVCQIAYSIRPRVLFIDSVQTLAEWDKGNRGQKNALLILQSMMSDIRAGKTHVVLISQLNKQNELKGARDLEHQADMVASVTKVEGRNGQFRFECTRKNRGGVTPRGAVFRHTETGVECIGDNNLRTSPYKLVQPTISPILQNGVNDPDPQGSGRGTPTEPGTPNN